MANVADYSIILAGEATVSVGNVFTRTFPTSRVLNLGERAILLLTARGLVGDVSVLINGQNVGQIRGAGNNDQAVAQTIVFRSDMLRRDAPNTIEITATALSTNFGLTDMVCIYRQDTGD
jgi:hypothetical protein